MEQRLGPAGEPYRLGRAGALTRASVALTRLGALGLALGRGRPRVARAGAALVLAGAATERFAVFQAGVQSAADPKYVVEGQRKVR
jgi:hypothetical protein